MNTSSPKKGKKKPELESSVAKPADELPKERIAKRMARGGLCSRREAEVWIAYGRVKVNGKRLDTPAFTVTARDHVEVDGKVLGQRERTRLWLFHKPGGTVTTNRDPDGRKTVFEGLPEELPRLMTVGRLDINTEGLLLMTNDGGLARVLELPATGWLRRYRVRVHGKPSEAELAKLADGMAVDGVLYGAIHAELEHVQGSNSWLSVSLREGKNREIKNVLGTLGLEVSRLIRISFGPFQLGDLPTGVIREIRSRTLREQLGEKLVAEAGADFEGPIVNLAPEVTRSATKAAAGPKKRTRRFQKDKKGVAREDALERLTTSRPKPKYSKSSKRKPNRGKPKK